MKFSIREFIYFLLSILLILFGGFIYLTFGRNAGAVSQTATSKATTIQTTKTESNSSDEEKLIEDLKKRLQDLAKNPNKDELNQVGLEVATLKDQTARKALQTSIEKIQEDLKQIETVSDLLRQAEETADASLLGQIQTELSKIKATTKKAELQERLNNLTASLTATPEVVDVADSSPTNDDIIEIIEEVSGDTGTTYQVPSTTYQTPNNTVTTPEPPVATPTEPVAPVTEPEPTIIESPIEESSAPNLVTDNIE